MYNVRDYLMLLFMSLLMTVGMEYTLQKDWSKVWEWGIHYPFYVILTVLFISGIYYVFANLISFSVATIITGILSYVWGVVNYFKLTMRNEFVIGDEVLLVLQGQMDFQKEDIRFSKHLLVFLVLVLVMIIVAFVWEHYRRKNTEQRKWKAKILHTVIGTVLSVCIGCGVYWGETLQDYLLDATQLEAKYGLLLSFIPNNCLPHIITNNNYEAMLSDDYKPTGTSADKITRKASESNQKSKNSNQTNTQPNVIIIMSESLYDTDHFDNIIADKDPMEKIHQYQENYGGGSCAVNIFGGGTANTEFEFLTGISTKYYCGNLMYNNYINENQMSMVGYMKQLGYHTVSIHPYKKSFFNREEVYSYFGFDESYFLENMTHTTDRFDITISDYSLTQEIIEKFENNEKNSDAPFFNFSVSVGNHKPCLSYVSGLPYVYKQKVNIQTENGKALDEIAERDVTRYYTGVYDTNQAFTQLVSYFEKVEEPTVILLFGDHAPPFADETYAQISSSALDDETLYQTPVVTWNNYGLDKWNVDNINANYLSTSFLEYLGFPLPKACIYNKNLMQYYYQTNSKKCVRDVNGNKINPQKLSKELEKIEKATMSLYEKELNMESSLLDLWDVPVTKKDE